MRRLFNERACVFCDDAEDTPAEPVSLRKRACKEYTHNKLSSCCLFI